MSEKDLVTVGLELTLTYLVVTEAGFPYGLQCMECGQAIEVGKPYASSVEAMIGDAPINKLTCVYC